MKNFITKLMLMALAGTMIFCSDDNDPKGKTFVLVHGAWQAPYVWRSVKSQLERTGHSVVLVELPAHGDDNTSPATTSMDLYRDKVINTINTISGNVVLIGHSMGGVVVTEVAEKIPAKIEKLIYIGAFVPASGQSLLDLALTDTQSQLAASLVPSSDQLTLDIKHDNIISIFCQDAPAAQQQLVLNNYRPEPAIPFTNKVVLTAANYGSVNKYYIHTADDHAIGIALQQRMVEGAKITHEYSLKTGHSPFLSAPDDVTHLLIEIVQ